VIEWPENDPIMTEELPRGYQKCMLNLILLCGEMVTKGGVIKVQKLADEELAVQITVDGDGVGFREGQRASLEGTVNAEDLDPRLIHAFVTGRFIRYFGFKLDFEKIGEAKHRFRLIAKT
jgi:histidine phosphotransferase ChpT